MATPSARPGRAVGPDDIDNVIAQLAELRQRVLNLEIRLGMATETPQVVPILPQPSSVPIADFELQSGIVPVVGRMFLAIAGAYVLRALTEWGTLPPAWGVSAGLLYGLVWLVMAARSPAGAQYATVINVSTSVLIVTPLIWEATQRLNVLSSAVAATVLVAFALASMALAVYSNQRIVATIGGVAAVAMSLVLIVARNDIVPFTVALLVMAAACEIAAWRELPVGARAFTALSADGAVSLFAWLMARSHAMPETWVAASMASILAAQIAIAVIYVATAVVHTVVKRRTLGFGEMAQTAAALLIGIGSAVWIFREHRAIVLTLGIAALAGGIACYAISFLLFEHDNKWNFRAWATFGLFLATLGMFLPFSRTGFWILACLCSVLCCWVAKIFHLPTLGLHGAVYLGLGSGVAGATSQSLRVLFGAGAAPVDWLQWIAVLAAAVAAWIAVSGIAPNGHGNWRNQVSSLAIAAHISCLAAALAVRAMLPTASPADMLSTVALMTLSIALASFGSRWQRRELVWLVYAVMLAGAWKLAVRDFANERNIALVVSLLCYGGALIVLPRILRGKPDAATGSP